MQELSKFYPTSPITQERGDAGSKYYSFTEQWQHPETLEENVQNRFDDHYTGRFLIVDDLYSLDKRHNWNPNKSVLINNLVKLMIGNNNTYGVVEKAKQKSSASTITLNFKELDVLQIYQTVENFQNQMNNLIDEPVPVRLRNYTDKQVYSSGKITFSGTGYFSGEYICCVMVWCASRTRPLDSTTEISFDFQSYLDYLDTPTRDKSVNSNQELADMYKMMLELDQVANIASKEQQQEHKQEQEKTLEDLIQDLVSKE